MGGQLPDYILYWELRNFGIDYRGISFLNVDRYAELFTNLQQH